jgi:hypothetical protein
MVHEEPGLETPMTAQPPSHVLLCDESGNTGSDYLDEDQQVFVYAGILLETNKLQELRAAVADVDRLYRQAREKKGWALTKDGKGRKALADFVRAVLAIGGKPLYSVVAKKFSVSGFLVATYFDPKINPAAGRLHPHDNINRKNLAEMLASLPDYYLNLFVEAFHNPTEQAFRKSINALILAMKSRHQHYVAKVLAGNLGVLPELVAAELADTDPVWGGRRKASISTNVGALFSFLQVADGLARRIEGASVEMLHDQMDSLAGALKATWDWGKQEAPPKVLRDGTEIRYGLDALQTMRFVGPSEESAIRAADFLAASARVLLELCVREKPWLPEFKELASIVAPTLTDPAAIHTHVSPAFHQRFTSSLAHLGT